MNSVRPEWSVREIHSEDLPPTGSAVEMSAARTGLVPTVPEPGVISYCFVLSSDVFIPASSRPRIISDVRAAVIGTGSVLASICDICAAVIGTRPVLAGLQAFIIADSGVRTPSHRLVVGTVPHPGFELVGLVFQPLRLGALTLRFRKTLLGVPLIVRGAQLCLSALTPRGCSSLIGRGLGRFGLGRQPRSLLAMISSLDLPTLIGLPTHSRKNQRGDDGQHDDNDDDHDDEGFHSTPP